MDPNAGRALRLYTKIAGRCFGRWKRGKLGLGAVRSETKMKIKRQSMKKDRTTSNGDCSKRGRGWQAGWGGREALSKGFVLGICLGLSCSVLFGFCSRRVESFKWRNKHSFVVALEAATTAPP